MDILIFFCVLMRRTPDKLLTNRTMSLRDNNGKTVLSSDELPHQPFERKVCLQMCFSSMGK
jgi:hypothetical protein